MIDPEKLIEVVGQELPIKEAYADALSPAAKEAGKALGTLGSVVNTVLRPLQSALRATNLLFDNLDGWVAEALGAVPAEQIREPPLHVAGPVIHGLLFAQNEPSLRDLFVQLLASSMVAGTQERAHPAFAEAIRQMTPREAQLVHILAQSSEVPYVTMRFHPVRADERWRMFAEGSMSDDSLRAMITMEWPGAFDRERRVTLIEARSADRTPLGAAFENLARLGVVTLLDGHDTEPREGEYAGPNDPYIQIARSPAVLESCRLELQAGVVVSLQQGVVALTEYGEQFLLACVGAVPGNRRARVPPPTYSLGGVGG